MSPDPVGFAISVASILYRCFLLPSDLAAYTGAMSRWRAQAARPAMPDERSAEVARRPAPIGSELTTNRQGLLTSLLTPAHGAILKTQAKSLAKHRAAEVLLAATRARLKSGEQPGSAESLVPEWLLAVPADPFRDEGSLTVKTSADGWLVYSVGPDGEDDGGPGPAGAAAVEGNDDVGLRLAR